MPPIWIKAPANIFNEPTDMSNISAQETTPEKTIREIFQERYPIPSKLKEENDIMKGLVLLIYSKLQKHYLETPCK